MNGGQTYPGNSIWDKPGLHTPSDVVGLRVAYDQSDNPTTTTFVFMDGGTSMVRLDTDTRTRKTRVGYVDDDTVIAFSDSLCAAPVTIGARHSRLGDGKLMSVMAIKPRMHDGQPSEEAVGRTNPLSYALSVQAKVLGIRH